MESSIVPVMDQADHGQGSNSVAASSQSGRSSVKNSSISIDLAIPLHRREDGECKHFKIRQYVVDMRGKDRNVCLPFASDDQFLPPMLIPESKWWQCQNCIYKNGTVSHLEDAVVVCNFHTRGLIDRTTSSPSPPNYDIEIVQSDIQDAPQSEGRIVTHNAPVNSSIVPRIDISFATDKNEKCSEVARVTEIARGDVYKGESQEGIPVILRGDEKHSSPYNDKNTEIGHRAVNGNENRSCADSIHESANANYNLARDDQDAIKSRSTVFVGTSVPTPGNQDTSDSFPEASQRKEFNPLDEEPRNGLAGSNGSNEATKLNKVNGQLVKHPSLQIEDRSNSFAESDKLKDLEDDSSEDSERPNKKRRLLEDLLRPKGNSENIRFGTEASPSNYIPSVPSRPVFFSVPQGRGNHHENMLGVKVPQRKRKIPYGQERKSMGTDGPSNPSKRAVGSKNTDFSSKTIEISDSDSDSESDSDSDSEGRVDGVTPNNFHNNIWSGRERSSLGKNRKPTQFGGQNLTKSPCREAIGKSNHTEFRGFIKHSFAADTSSSKPKDDFRGYMSPPRQPRERKSSMPRKKNIMLRVQDNRDFSRPHIDDHKLGEGSMKRNDVETMRNGTEVRKLQIEHDAHTDIPLDLSLNSYMPSLNDGTGHVKGGRGVVSSIPTGKSNFFNKDFMRKDVFSAGNSHNSTPGPCLESTLHSLQDKLENNNAKLREQRNYSPLPQNSNFPPSQNLDFSDPHYSVNNHGNQKNPEAMMLKCDQRSNKSFTEGSSDEIEEIAQLMAKNQYERGLNQSERNYSQLRRDDNSTNPNVAAFSKSNGKGVMTWTQREFPSTIARRIPSFNATINMRNMGSNLGPSKSNLPEWSNSVRNFFNNGSIENASSSIFETFSHSQSQSQPKISSSGEFSELGTVRNRNWQSREQNDMYTPNMSSPTNMQYVEPFNRSLNGLPLSETGRSWSPLATNHMPFDSIHQKGPNESTSSVRMYAPDKGKRIPNLDLNVVDLNGVNLDEQNKSFGIDYLETAPSEYQFFNKNTAMEVNPKGKDASYSNEAIPAMQLLSLMDAGMQSNKPFTVDGKKVVNKPLTACSNHPSISRNDKPDLVEKEFFPKSVPRSGPSENSGSMNTAHGKNHIPVKSWDYTPFSPSDNNNPYSSLVRNTENVRRGPPVPSQLFGRSLEQEKAKAPYKPSYYRDRRLEKSSVSHFDDLIRLRDHIPGKNKQREIHGGVDSHVFPFQRQKLSDPINLGSSFMQRTAGPFMQDQPRTDVCTINRNPADFSYPDAGNKYMINGEELKFGKTILYSGKSFLENGNGRKKRVRKITPPNERAPHRPI